MQGSLHQPIELSTAELEGHPRSITVAWLQVLQRDATKMNRCKVLPQHNGCQEKLIICMMTVPAVIHMYVYICVHTYAYICILLYNVYIQCAYVWLCIDTFTTNVHRRNNVHEGKGRFLFTLSVSEQRCEGWMMANNSGMQKHLT